MNRFQKTSYHFILWLIFFITNCSHHDDNSGTDKTSSLSKIENHERGIRQTTSDLNGQTLEKKIFLENEDVLYIKDSPLTVYHENTLKSELCSLTGPLQVLVEKKHLTYWELRPDRSFTKKESCEEAKTVYISSSEGAAIQSQGAGPLSPRTLNKAIFVFEKADLSGEALCKIAKGFKVLVNLETRSLQMPLTPHCELRSNMVYYAPEVLLWVRDIPQ